MTDRKAHWENVYTSKSPLTVSWYQQEPVLSLELIQNTGLDKAAPILDVGGGASNLVDRLLSEGFSNLAVLDISASALAHARNRLGYLADAAGWYEADVTAFDPPHRFQLWHDRAVFHFLTDPADRQSYVAVLKKALEPGGHLVIMAFAIGGPDKCSGLDIVQYDEEKVLAELGSEFDLCEAGHEVHMTPTGNEQKFAWFRLVYRPV